MKIVHIITRLINGGADENTVLTCNWFAEKGHDVKLLYGSERDERIASRVVETVELIQVPALCREISWWCDVQATASIRNYLARVRPDILHTHTSKAGIVGRLAAMGLRDCVVVHGIHILPFMNVPTPQRLLYLALEKIVAPRTDAFISVSEGMRVAAVSHGIGLLDRHHVAASGMDIGRFLAARQPIEPRPKRPLAVIYLANYEPRKRHLELIEMIERRRSAFQSLVRFRFAGRGPLQSEFRRLVQQKELQGVVEVGDFIEDSTSAIAAADVGIYCSSNEGLPRSIVQYCAVGKPIVATDLPGLDDVVRSGENGVVVPQDDFEALGDAVLRLAEHDTERVRLARGAQEVDLSEWSVERMCARIEEIYETAFPARCAAKSRRTWSSLTNGRRSHRATG